MHHISIASLCPVLIWLVLVFFFLSVCYAVQDGIARLKQLHQIPCSRCAFFTGNYHLKCTVHPCRALSEEAIGCIDYEPVSTAALTRSIVQSQFKKPLERELILDYPSGTVEN